MYLLAQFSFNILETHYQCLGYQLGLFLTTFLNWSTFKKRFSSIRILSLNHKFHFVKMLCFCVNDIVDVNHL